MFECAAAPHLSLQGRGAGCELHEDPDGRHLRQPMTGLSQQFQPVS